jgi:hypothetical protein
LVWGLPKLRLSVWRYTNAGRTAKAMCGHGAGNSRTGAHLSLPAIEGHDDFGEQFSNFWSSQCWETFCPSS